MNLQRIFFNTEDQIELTGLLAEPASKSKKVIISIHGMQSNCLKRREAILEKQYIENNVAYFSFNNRGQDLMCYTKNINGGKTLNGGSVFEDVLDSYYDVKASIEKMLECGYKEIYLQGHSLGCTKIIYSYNRLKKENYDKLEFIKGIILLSWVDIIELQKYELGKDKYDKMLALAEKMENEGNGQLLMPKDAFEHPISVKSYLRYYRDNKEIDFARFSENNFNFETVNNIKIPLFLRWGNIHDLVIQNLNDLILFLKEKIKNNNLDIGYIDGADHGYTAKETEVAKEILDFVFNK